MSASQTRWRGASKARRRANTADRLDVETLAFYERVREGYLELAAGEPGRFHVIDSSGDPRRTEEQMIATLESIESLQSPPPPRSRGATPGLTP